MESATDSATAPPLREACAVAKYFGSVNALQGMTLKVTAGEVAYVLGDVGAGKSGLIKILSGGHVPDKGELLIEGESVSVSGPRDAGARGIVTVFQDLATVPLDVGAAQLLPRQRADARTRPTPAPRRQRGAARDAR